MTPDERCIADLEGDVRCYPDMPETGVLSIEEVTVRPEASMGVDTSQRIAQLDGLRAVAILLVIACHYQAFAGSLLRLPAFGWVGVDMFFVLSGFLITSILLRCKGRPDPYIPFLARRAIRIMPAYYTVLCLVAAACCYADRGHLTESLTIFWQHAFFYSSLIDTAGYVGRAWSATRGLHVGTLFAAQPLPFAQSGFGAATVTGSLTHFWSVSVEEWYYILWAPVVLCFSRRFMTIAGSFLILLAFYCRSFGFIDWQWYLSFPCRVDMLGVGSLFALWHEARSRLHYRRRSAGDGFLLALTVTSLVTLAVLIFHIRPVIGHEIRDSRLFASFGPPCIAVAIAGLLGQILHRKPKGVTAAALSVGVLTYIGRRSYMMYLAHVPVYLAFRTLLPAWPALVSLCSLGSTIALASLSWRYLESPLLKNVSNEPNSGKSLLVSEMV